MVGRKISGQIVRAVMGQPRCLAASGRHQEHVQVAVPITRKGNLLAIVESDRVAYPGAVNGQGSSTSALRGYAVNIPVVAEQNRCAVGRDGCVTKPITVVLGSPLGGEKNSDHKGDKLTVFHLGVDPELETRNRFMGGFVEVTVPDNNGLFM